jgi:hypothetical protein
MAVTGWSGLYENEHGAEYALLVDKSSIRKKIGKLLRRRNGRVISEKLTTLLSDATPASTAAVTFSRVSASKESDDDFGGVRTIETRTLINTAVLAADVTSLKKFLEGGAEQDSQPTYASDASGNGGGGKLGF